MKNRRRNAVLRFWDEAFSKKDASETESEYQARSNVGAKLIFYYAVAFTFLYLIVEVC